MRLYQTIRNRDLPKCHWSLFDIVFCLKKKLKIMHGSNREKNSYLRLFGKKPFSSSVLVHNY